jgi:hypothetical protein
MVAKGYDTLELAKAFMKDGVFTKDQADRLVRFLIGAGLIEIGRDPPPDMWEATDKGGLEARVAAIERRLQELEAKP